MTFEQIRIAVESKLASWDGVPVEYDGAPQSQELIAAIEAKQSWARATIQHGNSSAPYKGSEPGIRRTGLLTFQIFTDKDKGSRPAALLADSLAEHFQFYRSGGLELLTASVQRVGPDSGWYMYLVSVPFRAG
ncbi:phage tail terminator-like protein [Halomonas sp. 5021]|uniref:phage tail terminator-like protein n=1 Tax=Halomonas sp. 5021 TaxID=3082156 RepID=UPI002FC8454E